mgnify:FL=1
MKGQRGTTRGVPSRDGFATGHTEGLAGHEKRFTRGKEHEGRGDLGRLAGAVKGTVLPEMANLFIRLPSRRLQRGPEWPGRDGVHRKGLDELFGADVLDPFLRVLLARVGDQDIQPAQDLGGIGDKAQALPFVRVVRPENRAVEAASLLSGCRQEN